MTMNQYEQTDPLWRLMSKVNVTDDCWLWTGSLSEGVPQFYAGPGKCARPARFLLEWLTGQPLPRSTRLRWECGDSTCVRPSHVTPVPRGDAFWSNVQAAPLDECWLWTGAVDKGGYGRGRIRTSTETSTLAHRQAFHQLRAPIPAGLELDHLCHQARCVNPWHLEPVTSVVNLARRRPVKDTHHTHSTQLIGA
jgi:hypothetical protein